MSNREWTWSQTINYLATAGKGCFAEVDGWYVEIVNMCGGRDIVFDKYGWNYLLTNSVIEAVNYIKAKAGTEPEFEPVC